MSEVLALIPARGGSKGIPQKNLRPLRGKPLVAYSIESALAARSITRVIVSTDSEEIAEVAIRFGAEVPFMRPDEFARDDSIDLDVFTHALTWLTEHEQYSPNIIAQLRPTCPIRLPERIDEAIALFADHPEADSLRSITLADQTPYKMWRADGFFLLPLLTIQGVEEPYNQPRQTLPQVFWQNGYLDLTRANTVLKLGQMNGEKILGFQLNDRWVDIDREESLYEAEKLLARVEADGPQILTAVLPNRYSS